MERAEIKEAISLNFVHAMEQMGEIGIIKNISQFFSATQTNRSAFSKIKKAEGNYVTLDLIYHAVNELGLNANHVFSQNPKKEDLLRDSINSPTINGNNNNVVSQNGKLNVNGNTGTISEINIAEKIIQQIPDKKQKAELKKHMSLVTEEIGTLKKMVENYKKQIEDKDKEIAGDKKLIETQDKLIKMYETGKSKKK